MRGAGRGDLGMVRFLSGVAWAGLWLAVIAVALATRPPLPVDETRYLAVAWEMWRDGEFLVPHLNGATYSHKPPLLFWLINLGWSVTGVNDWWPRLVAPLFGLGCLALTGLLARRLWPADGTAAAVAPLVLLGCVFWALFTTLTMFDMILAFCAVLGLIGVVEAWRGRRAGFALLALGIGLGVLAKGPAILLHTLPVALLAPWWGPALGGDGPGPRPRRWFLGVAGAVAAGAVLALAWAVPAGIHGGEAYRDAIFWGQSAGRMVESFAHERPWWWFLAVLPPLILPWIVWPPLWRAVRGAGGTLADGGVRLCLVWFLVALAAFSAISGKQLHYLLPEFPALALVFARLLARPAADGERRFDQAVPGLLMAVLAAAALIVLYVPLPLRLPTDAALADGAWMAAVMAAGLAVAAVPLSGLVKRIALLAGLSVVLVAAIHLAARPVLARAYDLSPLSARLHAWEREGYALAHSAKYHGQFNFLGRLQRPVVVIGMLTPDVETWVRDTPKGKVISYRNDVPADPPNDFVQPYRGRYIIVWDRDAVAADPSLGYR